MCANMHVHVNCTSPHIHSACTQVLMFPSGELAGAVLGLIHDILDRKDPAVRVMALRSGLLYLALYSFRYLRSCVACCR